MRQFFGTTLLLLFVLSGCAIQVPDVKVRPESSPEQRKAIGDPRQLPCGLAELPWNELAERPLLAVEQARRRQKKRRAELDTLERGGVVGETRTGEVLLLDEKKLHSSLERRRVSRLVEEENKDRVLIKKWLLQCFSPSAPVPPDSVEAALIRRYQQLAPPGTWIQSNENQWEQKKR